MEPDGSLDVAGAAARLRDAVGSVIVGKAEATTLLLVALLCEGHVLLEDVPGVGKTMLAKALARALDLSFQRIQFTPDLLPSDVTGLSYFNQQTQRFEFRPGPIFANVVLADEINRATPRTQSALLEAMEERQVTVDGETRPLPRPFIVLATQNPVELEGTFPLPEAQLDRFLLRLTLGYPDRDEERQVARRFYDRNPLETLTSVLSAQDVTELAQRCRRVHVGEAVEGYLVDVVRATRSQKDVALGASPRATLAMFRASQALAAIDGRDYVTPDDVKRLATALLSHRLVAGSAIFTGPGGATGAAPLGALAIDDVLLRVPVPVEGENGAASVTQPEPPRGPMAPATVRTLR
ncbi:MAG TPA: AAA family ATPase [Chloroflexota bacterium]|nr:AAA family ATPase [Chloroflexota bacterium]